MLKKYIFWVNQAWPFFLLLPLIFVHYLLLTLPCLSDYFLCYDDTSINKLISFILQLLGGLLIVYSIDSNMGLFKNRSLISLSLAWVKRFPGCKPKVIQLQTVSAVQRCEASRVSITTHKAPKTIEEKIDDLYKKLGEHKTETQKDKLNFQSQLEAEKKLNQQNQASNSRVLTDMRNKLENISIGGLKLQLFGVNLLVYGAILSYVA